MTDSSFNANYPNQSDKARKADKPKARPQLERVTTSEVVQRKKPMRHRVADTLFPERAQSIGQFVLQDVIVPTVKDLLYEVVTAALGRSMWGNAGRRAVNRFVQGPQQGPGGFVSYNLMSQSPSVQKGPGQLRAMQPDEPTRSSRDFGQFVFPNRGEAEFVLERLVDVVREYQVVTVSELFTLIGQPATTTDHKWGWFNLSGAAVQGIHGGFVLTLPAPVLID